MRKKWKWLLCIAAAVCMMCGLLSGVGFAAKAQINGDFTISDGDIIGAETIGETGGDMTVYLPDGVTATVTGTIKIRGTVTVVGSGKLVRGDGFTTGPMIYVEKNATLNLGTDIDADGIVLEGNNLETGGFNGGAVYVAGGTLNLRSNVRIFRHVLIGNAGAAIAAESGVINMYNGWLAYNETRFSQGGGAVYLAGSPDGTVMHLYGGAIGFNQTNGVGGGILADGDQTGGRYTDLYISGGMINDNNAGEHGGGVEILNNARLVMSGGKITSNSDGKDSVYKSGAGVYVNASTRRVELSGWAQITDNFVLGTHEQSNMLFYGMNDLKVTGDLTGSVGVHNCQFSLNQAGKQLGVVNGNDYTGIEKIFCDTGSFVGKTEMSNIVWSDGTSLSEPECIGFDAPAEGVPLSVKLPENETAVYQWYTSETNDLTASGVWSAIPDAMSASYTPAVSDTGKYLICVMRGAGGNTGERTVVTDTVVAAASIEKPAILVFIDTTGCSGLYDGTARVPVVRFDGAHVPETQDYQLIYSGSSGTEYNSTQAPMQPGNYTVVFSLTRQGAQQYRMDDNSVTQGSFMIEAYQPEVEAVIQNEPQNGWLHSSIVTLTAPAGFTISTSNLLEGNRWNSAMEADGTDGADKTAVYYLKNNNTGAISERKEIYYQVDTMPPEGTIHIGQNLFGQFIEEPQYEIFSKSEMKTKIESWDALSGIARVEYQKASGPQAYSPAGPWASAEEFMLLPGEKVVVYARITDNAGNVAIINSAGIVVYRDSELKTTKAIVKKDGSSAAIEIQFNGNTVDSIRLGDRLLVSGTDYIETDDKIILQGAFLETLEVADSAHTFTVLMRPLGECFYPKGGNEAPAELKFQVQLQKKEQQSKPCFLEHQEIVRKLGETAELPKVTGGQGAGAYEYRSSNPGIVTVNSKTGGIEIVGIGTADIYVKKLSDETFAASDEDYITVRVNGILPGNRITVGPNQKLDIGVRQEFINEGTLIIEGECRIDGKLVNHGNLIINGILINNGTFFNTGEGITENKGRLDNNGTSVNAGNLMNWGTVENCRNGLLDNQNELANKGKVLNNGIINNSGIIHNAVGASFENNSQMHNAGAFIQEKASQTETPSQNEGQITDENKNGPTEGQLQQTGKTNAPSTGDRAWFGLVFIMVFWLATGMHLVMRAHIKIHAKVR